jgi:nucleotide-binding universal stress UspA family protein
VVCGGDGSAAGEEAVRQAVRLADPWGEVVLVTVAMVAAGAHPESVPALCGRAAAVLEAAGRVAGQRAVERRVVEAEPVASLLAAAEHYRATLLAVGSHGTGRAAGVVTGSVATVIRLRRWWLPLMTPRWRWSALVALAESGLWAA